MPIYIFKKENFPNFLTVFRLFLSVFAIFFFVLNFHFFALQKKYLWFKFESNLNLFSVIACVFLLLSIISDFLDGFLARKWKVISNFGKVYDPVVDKFLIIGFFIVFIIYKQAYFWPVFLLIFRDIFMDIQRIYLSKKNIIIPASKLAKWKTATQMLAIFVSLLFLNCYPQTTYNKNLSLFFLIIPLIFSYISLFGYMRQIYLLKNN